MNPRVSRSSALASKATGFPIAKIAARLAVGYTLDEIPNDITGETPASFEPAIDYVVVKWPRFAFEKFPGVDATLATQMKSRRRGDGDRAHLRRGVRQGAALARARQAAVPRRAADEELLDALGHARRRALRGAARAARRGAGVERCTSARDRPVVPARAAGRGSRARPRQAPFRGERSFDSVDTCAAEFPARTPYYYSAGSAAQRRDEVHAAPRRARRS